MDEKVIIKNARCLTMDESSTANKRASWICYQNGVIKALDSDADGYFSWADGNTTIIDAEGNTVLPGFIDNQFHLVYCGVIRHGADLGEARTLDEVRTAVKMALKDQTSGFLIAHNYLPDMMEDGQKLDRKKLDAICGDIPLAVWSKDMHTIILNSCGVLYFKVPFVLDGVEKDDNDVPTGIFKRKAGVRLYSEMVSRFSDEYCDSVVWEVMKDIHANGITTVADLEGGNMGVPANGNREAEFIYMKGEKYPLNIVLCYPTLDIDKIVSMGLNRIGGALYVDGTMSARTAALTFDYADDPGNRGTFCISREYLNEFVLECYRRGLQTGLDAIGDAAIEWVISAHEYAAERFGVSKMRHRIEHAELITEPQMERAAKLGLILCMQPAYEMMWGGKGKMYEQRLGERYLTSNPFREILDHGIRICGGSDVMDINPMVGIHYAVNHPVSRHSVTLEEALKMYTSDGAYTLFLEDKVGSLRAGMAADIVILDSDIETVDKSQLKDVGVAMTIKDGELVYVQKDGQAANV